MTVALGVDVGSSTIKGALYRARDGEEERLALYSERIRRRDPAGVADRVVEACLEQGEMTRQEVDYLATTGEGELVRERTGHFYGMTTHARGAIALCPEAEAVLDLGALHGRGIKIDPRGRVLGYRMTSRCASGSGQFLENIGRYLGVPLEDLGSVSLEAGEPEAPSSICAVLAETDVINMVSRGIATPDILGGIHQSMAGRAVKLLAAIDATGVVCVTGGLSMNRGLMESLKQEIEDRKLALEVRTHPDAIYAGAIGAALWGTFRAAFFEKDRARLARGA